MIKKLFECVALPQLARINKKNTPSLGFIILLITIIISALFLNWVQSLLNYEKAIKLENKAHTFTKEGKTSNKIFFRICKNR